LLHQETAHESLVGDWIGDNQDIGSQNRMGAERVIARNLIQFQLDFGLKPYPLLIDECDNGYGGIAHESSQMSDVVECLLAGSSQDSKAMKAFETGTLVFWLRQPQ